MNRLALAEYMSIGRLGCYRRAFEMMKTKYSPTSGEEKSDG